jgi:hypothetical protein
MPSKNEFFAPSGAALAFENRQLGIEVISVAIGEVFSASCVDDLKYPSVTGQGLASLFFIFQISHFIIGSCKSSWIQNFIQESQ